MPNPTVNTPVLTQPSIKTLKEPFCKAMIEVSNESVDHKDPAKTTTKLIDSNEVKTKFSPESSRDPTTITVASALLPLFNPSGITDRELLRLCQQYGGNSRAWKRKFEELLPEVLKRHLYKKHRFISIYEFSAKLCGLSKDSVDNVIRVYGQLEDKPILRSLVVEFGWSKLRIVAGIATPETDASWAEKVRVLPSSSLETFVRDLKRQEENERIEIGLDGQSENKTIALCQSIEQGKSTDQQSLSCHQFPIRPIFRTENLQSSENSGQTSIRLLTQLVPPLAESAKPENKHIKQSALITDVDQPQNNRSTISLKLNPETDFRLRKLKSRIEKGKKEKISFNQLFETMLNIIENKEKITKKQRNPYGMAPLKLCKI